MTVRPLARLVVAPLAALSLAGCAFAPGEPIATLEPTLDARLAAPEDRQIDGGWQRLASDWQVRVVRLDLVVDEVVVEAAGDVASPAPGGSFDPAAPPRGYGSCHDGHCHADDGRLVSYEEIEAELAGEGAAAPRVAADMHVGAVPLIAAEPLPLDCGPCVLDEGRLTSVRLVASRLEVELEVRDGRPSPRIPGTFAARGTIDLGPGPDEAAPGELATAIDATITEDAPPVVALEVGVHPSVALLDAVDLAALPDRDGARDLSAAAAAIRAAFATLELDARVARRDD